MSGDIRNSLIGKHPVIANLIIIVVIGVLGIWIVYFSIAIFTKHGESDVVPSVENMSYTQAIETLHARGLNVDIRDSLFRDDIKPGYVIEQFPKANSVVKPGRKVFLYINAVHPKEVVIDDNHNPADLALRGLSYRQGMARLQELGFKNIKTVRVLGDNDRIVKITANGVPVRQMQKVAVNSRIVIEVSDGRLAALRDSLYELERMNDLQVQQGVETAYGGSSGFQSSDYSGGSQSGTSSSAENEEEDEVEYF